MLYALSGISGAGKTTLLEVSLQRKPALARLTTVTTRLPRPGEVDGHDYYFVEAKQFQEYVDAGQIVCPIAYRDAQYGTLLADVRACREEDTLGVLRPDKLRAMTMYTPLIGIYVEMQGHERPASLDDEIIYQHRQDCVYHIPNIPGHLEQAVLQLLSLLEKEEREHARKNRPDPGRAASLR